LRRRAPTPSHLRLLVVLGRRGLLRRLSGHELADIAPGPALAPLRAGGAVDSVHSAARLGLPVDEPPLPRAAVRAAGVANAGAWGCWPGSPSSSRRRCSSISII